MVRIRAHLDGRRQCLCRPAGDDLCAAARKRPEEPGLSRLAVHDGLERRAALGRAHLPPAGGTGRVGADRRLHRRRRLCGGTGVQERHRLRHGRHHREMRAGRERPLLGRVDLLRRRLCEGLPDQVAGDQHRRGRLRRRLDRLARPAEPAACRSAERGLDTRPRLLRQWRQGADRHRRQSRAGPAQSGSFPRRRTETRCRRGACGSRAHRRAARLCRRRAV